MRVISRVPRICVAANLAVLALLVALPASVGATTTVSYSSSTGVLLQGDAAGEGVGVGIRDNGTRFIAFPVHFANVIADGNIVAGGGCALSSSGVVIECPLTSSRIVTARLGDGADGFAVDSESFPLDQFLNGEGGNDQVRGSAGFDSISGGPGADVLGGGLGDDLLQGGDGNDRFEQQDFVDVGGTDTLRGDAGNDTFQANRDSSGTSSDLFDGGGGVDVADYSKRTAAVTLRTTVSSTTGPDDGAPGEADDLDNVETLIGGSGNDTLEVSNTFASLVAPKTMYTLRGNDGADTLRAVRQVRTFLDGGLGTDTITGGSAVDTIFSREGEFDAIACGSDIDTLKPDLRDVPISADCENLDQSDRREGPNVAIRNRLARVGDEGSLGVRLACPRSVRIGCRGALSARLDRRGTRFGSGERYSLRPGRSAVVQVQLRRAQVASARRRGARVRVRSVERGVHGPKTTQRSLAARAR